MARKRQFGKLTEKNQEKIAQQGARYGLTRRQARERYNRGTFNPLARTPEKRIPKRAPYYPVEVGRELKDRAIANADRAFDYNDPFSEANRIAVVDAIEHHASERALIRMANASPDELKKWAKYQGARSYRKVRTPDWVRDLGWRDDEGKWHNIFWYH